MDYFGGILSNYKFLAGSLLWCIRSALVAGFFVLSSTSQASGFAQGSVSNLKVWIYKDPGAFWAQETPDPSTHRDDSWITLNSEGRYYLLGGTDGGFSMSTTAYPTYVYSGVAFGGAFDSKAISHFELPNGYRIAYSGVFEAQGTLSGTSSDQETMITVGFRENGSNDLVDSIIFPSGVCQFCGSGGYFHQTVEVVGRDYNSGWLAYTQGNANILFGIQANVAVPVPEVPKWMLMCAGLMIVFGCYRMAHKNNKTTPRLTVA